MADEMKKWPGDIETLAWLNQKTYRLVFSEDIAFDACESLVAKGHAVRLGNNTGRIAITMLGVRALQQPGDGQEKKR